jgi:SpoVK/Ycf46/Vps4 family AAA+-type ATPase
MNKDQSKSLLSSIQKITKLTRGQELTTDLITDITDAATLLAEFYEISVFQAIILSLFLDTGLRDRDVDTEGLIEHFGVNMASMADVNEAIDELLKLNLVYVSRSDYRIRKKSYRRIIKAHDKVLDALVKGEKELLQATKVNDFFGVLMEVRALIVQRIDDVLTTDDLIEQTKKVLEANTQFPEVEWLSSLQNLSIYDTCLLLDVTIEHLEGAEEVDIDKLLKEIFSDIPDRVKYKKNIKEGKCQLFKTDLLVNSDDIFSFMNYVRLSDSAMEILLSGSKEVLKKEFKSKVATLINPDSISQENLFYNESELKQIDTLKEALSDTQYQEISSRMKDLGMKAGFTVLLYGYPGTGKTSTVKQVAKLTGRTIYMVDIQKIQSKWVGESEKNLARVFSEYKDARRYFEKDPILLFNEADAILGKRMNVNSSVDKTFNALQNILLQELEDFEGIFMATTNLADQLDMAFDRRFLYKLNYQKPKDLVRFNILKNNFNNVDVNFLSNVNSRFELTGGQITNIKKKILVESIMNKELNTEEAIERFCIEECILNTRDRNPIGFLNNN